MNSQIILKKETIDWLIELGFISKEDANFEIVRPDGRFNTLVSDTFRANLDSICIKYRCNHDEAINKLIKQKLRGK